MSFSALLGTMLFFPFSSRVRGATDWGRRGEGVRKGVGVKRKGYGKRKESTARMLVCSYDAVSVSLHDRPEGQG